MKNTFVITVNHFNGEHLCSIAIIWNQKSEHKFIFSFTTANLFFFRDRYDRVRVYMYDVCPIPVK